MAKISMRVTVPKTKFSSAKFVDAILRKMKTDTVPDLKGLFSQTTEGWKNQPSWSSKTWSTSSQIGSFVYPSGDGSDIYRLVSLGSPKHPINAKRGGLLVFRHGSGYTASTRPGFLRSRANSSTGSWVAKPSVEHPGFEAREFPKTIRDEYESQFRDDMQNAMNEAAKS